MRNIYLFLVLFVLGSCGKPIANFNSPLSEEIVPYEVQFSNTSKGAKQYHWDFGDGNSSQEENPRHTYTHSGRYKVTLKATNGAKENVCSHEIFFKAPVECLVRMKTNFGDMTFKLDDATPLHRDNFIKLVKESYYNDLLFHRVIENFMVQGGDPDSRNAPEGKSLGIGGPSYKVPAEFNVNLVHMRGALAAARQGDQVNPEKQSSGSQFYIVHGNSVTESLLDKIENNKGFIYPDSIKTKYLEKGGTPFLDQDYTVFGMMTNGFDVLDKIARSETDQRDRPKSDVKILSIEIIK